jgi:hypothetical protein
MGQTSDPETLVIHQKLKPGNNPKNFKQHYDHGGSLQLRICLSQMNRRQRRCPCKQISRLGFEGITTKAHILRVTEDTFQLIWSKVRLLS